MRDNQQKTDSTHDQTPDGKAKAATSGWKSWVGFAVLLALVYFGNVELQSWLGKKALANTGLETLPLASALTKAKTTNKHVLADMSAIWCSTCRKLDSEIFSNDQVKKAINEKYVFSRIEYESTEGEAFMQKYQVSGFPTLLILDADGNALSHLKLTFNVQDFIAQL